MNLNYNKKTFVWFLIAIIILSVPLFSIKIPYSVSVFGKILPKQEWIISKGTDGRLITVFNDNITGLNQNYSVSQFERGDAIQFVLNPKIKSGSFIKTNDTIAILYSNEIERQFIQLKGELQVAQSTLNVYLTGEKQQVVQEEKERLEFMRKQAEEQKKIFKRLEALYQKNLVSVEEYEIAKGNAELNEINIKIAEARLQSVQSGMKKEQIDLIKSQIQSLQNQIDVLQKRFKSYLLISKLSGVINSSFSSDTLITVSDTSKLVLLIPVSISKANFLNKSQKVEVYHPYTGFMTEGIVIQIDKNVYQLNGEQVYIIKAIIEKDKAEFTNGLLVKCKLICPPIKITDYLKQIYYSSLR